MCLDSYLKRMYAKVATACLYSRACPSVPALVLVGIGEYARRYPRVKAGKEPAALPDFVPGNLWSKAGLCSYIKSEDASWGRILAII